MSLQNVSALFGMNNNYIAPQLSIFDQKEVILFSLLSSVQSPLQFIFTWAVQQRRQNKTWCNSPVHWRWIKTTKNLTWLAFAEGHLLKQHLASSHTAEIGASTHWWEGKSRKALIAMVTEKPILLWNAALTKQLPSNQEWEPPTPPATAEHPTACTHKYTDTHRVGSFPVH